MAQYRQNRIAEEIKKNLDRIIREEMNDPRVNSTFSITRVETSRDLRYAKVYVSVLEDGKLEVALERSAARSVVNDLSRKLEQWTGRRWTVIVSNEAGEPTLRAQAQAAKEKLTDGVHADPRVQAVIARFPGTQVIDVRRIVPDTGSGADESGPVAAAEEDDDDL